MFEKICKYCKWHRANDSYCDKWETTKSGKSTCDEYQESKFAHIR